MINTYTLGREKLTGNIYADITPFKHITWRTEIGFDSSNSESNTFKPTYILGGKEDIAYENGMDDFHRISKVPAFAANLPVGHGGTYAQPHGGEFSIPALAWLNWNLKGDKNAAKMFLGNDNGMSQRKDWTIEKNELVDQPKKK